VSTDGRTDASGLEVDDAIRALLLLMPRMVGRVKRIRIPEELQSLSLTPRHLSLLSYLIFDGPLSVNELAARLEIAPATVSLMVSEMSRKGILDRREDKADRRRRIVSIAVEHRPTIDRWLAQGATAWRNALQPLTPDQRQLFIDTLKAYEGGIEGSSPHRPDAPV
jgi:DNA-binding MarR family transcriptional regulator